MNLIIGGGVDEHGRNCFYMEDEICYCVDCGIMSGDKSQYPRLSAEQLKKIKYLFLTHRHIDHIGAFAHFVECGFCGTVIGTAETLSALPEYKNKFILPQGGREISFTDIVFSYGRSGHCIGAVWYRISTHGGAALFSGDYSEESAFCVDKIKNMAADIAVLDCAFGNEEYDGEEQLKKICAYVKGKRSVILPVPENGRGVDLICALASLNKPIYIDAAQETFLKKYSADDFWIDGRALKGIENARIFPLSDFYGGIALISDAQLFKEESRALVRKYLDKGASVLITGHCDEGSFSDKLLSDKRAEKIALNAHCCKSQADKTAQRNSFKKIIYYHSASHVFL